MTDHVPLPPAMVQRARDFRGSPAQARAAATVVLLRPAGPSEGGRPPGAGPEAPGVGSEAPGVGSEAPGTGSEATGTGFEVYVLRRRTTMVFGGVYAFPGGGVDPADRLPPGGPMPHPDFAARLGLPLADAAAVVAAAVREVFEETTVRLDPGLLLPWTRWITPEFEPRRFDTWFFVAPLPAKEVARDISGEADLTAWISPAEALARYAAGDLAMLPPTVAVLRDLAAYRRISDVVTAAAGRDAARPVVPRVTFAPDGVARLRLP